MENEDDAYEDPLYIECGVCEKREAHCQGTPVGWRYAQVTEICSILVCSEDCQRVAEGDKPVVS